MLNCWCGNTDLSVFSDDYAKCSACETLVSRLDPPMAQETVSDDETDFYGKQYWLGHQQQELGYPDIYARARSDLKERNIHWLKALLKYSLPPDKILELGCGHGSFVALMSQAGYDVAGVEMSPWVVEFGRKTFEVPILVGPVEDLEIAPQSLDVIVLMDVLEHLSNPLATIERCLPLLKPSGFLLIQTPEFQSTMRYEALVAQGDPFLSLLEPREHLYLFSRQSVTQLLHQLDVKHLYFEPAIFSHYDMFLVAAKTPLVIHSVETGSAALQKTVGGRMALSMIDLRDIQLECQRKLEIADADRTARLKQVHILTDQLEQQRLAQQELAQRLEQQQLEQQKLQQQRLEQQRLEQKVEQRLEQQQLQQQRLEQKVEQRLEQQRLEQQQKLQQQKLQQQQLQQQWLEQQKLQQQKLQQQWLEQQKLQQQKLQQQKLEQQRQQQQKLEQQRQQQQKLQQQWLDQRLDQRLEQQRLEQQKLEQSLAQQRLVQQRLDQRLEQQRLEQQKTFFNRVKKVVKRLVGKS
ncbi:Methyltransferase domain family [Synechococcus sp. PCC 7335]|uniref:class I SAM-dependent methyltransferase n=1 Tax=Synechococcus sp. (strain ATCC 29403 / PCC 7335) TaxID=91464 RepID=UPI00017ED27E|nr:class I SAM-dependent methyltransferase [Synechococcus sp. PCC 7335]EDX84824.1 Methyltransferase domain family [Synechococcus sp. PCC 7335]